MHNKTSNRGLNFQMGVSASQVRNNSINPSLNFKPQFENFKPQFENL